MKPTAFNKIAFIMAPSILVIILGAHFFLAPALLEEKIIVPAYILACLNIVFLGFTSLSITYLAAKSYISSGAPSILLLSNGALIFGTASIISEWFLYAGGGINIADIITNKSALLTGCFYFAATLSVLVDWPRDVDPTLRKRKLAISFASVLVLEGIIASAAFLGAFPVFFVEGLGPSPLRQMIAGGSAVLLFTAGLHILLFYAVNRTEFLFWYGLALMIIAEGLLGDILERSNFGLIGWTGRLAQYLGGLYLLMAASTLFRQRPLEHVLAELLNKPAALYTSVFENSMDGIVLGVARGPLLAANPQALSMLGYNASEVRQLALENLLMGENSSASAFLDENDLESRFRGELPMIRKDGSTFPAEITSSFFEDHQGTLIRALLFRDVTERKQSREALRHAHAQNERNLVQLRAMFNQMSDGLVIVTPEGRLSDINQAALQIYGFEDSAQVKMHLDRLGEVLEMFDLDGNKLPPCQWPIGRALKGETFNSVEVYVSRRDIDKTWTASYSGTPVYDSDGNMLLALVGVRDITPRIKAEEQIRQSLKEKETLLQEIHHRVKNNMQVIISLLNLQSSTIHDEKVKSLFKESSSRVNAMALIHNYLYQSASLSEIDLNQYFESLAGSLISMYNKVSQVNIRVTADHIKLNMDQAIPCGLIINELISNALKHAFPENKTGQIKIEANRIEDVYVINISDNGVGLPDAVYHGEMESLGLKLVRGLAENQLGGRVSVARDDGTRFTIEIPVTI